MKPGCTLHPLRTGFRLFTTPSIFYRIPNKIFIWKIKRLKDDIEELVSAGAKHIELVDDVIQFTPDFIKKFRKEMDQIVKYIKELEKNGVTLSVHVAHIGYNIPPRFKELTSGTIARFKNMAEYYKKLDPIHYTLHLGVDEIFYSQVFKDAASKRALIKKASVRTLAIKEILRRAPAAFNGLKEAGIDLKKVYIENSEGMTRREFDALFDPLSKMFPELGCILDTGHLLVEEYLNNKRCLENFVEHWGKEKKKLKAVHIHDVFIRHSIKNRELLTEIVNGLNKLKQKLGGAKGLRGELDSYTAKLEKVIDSSAAKKSRPPLDDHQILGTGKGILNAPLFLKALKGIDFKGPIIFEAAAYNYKQSPESVNFLAEEIEKIKKQK